MKTPFKHIRHVGVWLLVLELKGLESAWKLPSECGVREVGRQSHCGWHHALVGVLG